MTIDKDEYQRRMTKVNRAFLVLTILFFVILVSFMILLINVRHISAKAVTLSKENKTLLRENNERIKEEKRAAIVSCKHSYSGIRDVFEIFFPIGPSKEEKKNIDKFNNRIDDLQRACDKSADN